MRKRRISALHFVVLGWFVDHQVGIADEIADALELPVVLVDAILADLASTGMIEPGRVH